MNLVVSRNNYNVTQAANMNVKLQHEKLLIQRTPDLPDRLLRLFNNHRDDVKGFKYEHRIHTLSMHSRLLLSSYV